MTSILKSVERIMCSMHARSAVGGGEKPAKAPPIQCATRIQFFQHTSSSTHTVHDPQSSPLNILASHDFREIKKKIIIIKVQDSSKARAKFYEELNFWDFIMLPLKRKKIRMRPYVNVSS